MIKTRGAFFQLPLHTDQSQEGVQVFFCFCAELGHSVGIPHGSQHATICGEPGSLVALPTMLPCLGWEFFVLSNLYLFGANYAHDMQPGDLRLCPSFFLGADIGDNVAAMSVRVFDGVK